MALDIAKLRQRLNELKGSQSAKESLWKPQEGENRVRVVPLKTNSENPFIELYFHNLAGKTYLSPISFGERDPIAEFGESLRSGGNLSKEEWQETKKFIPYRRIFLPVVDRKHPESGVKLWAFGKTVYSDLLTIMADPEYGDITDPQTGRDIKVNFTPQDKSDTNFAKTTIQMAANSSALTTDGQTLKKWLNEQPNIDEVYQKTTFDELKAVLARFCDVAPEAESTHSVEPSEPTPVVREKKKTVSDVEDEFDALFK